MHIHIFFHFWIVLTRCNEIDLIRSARHAFKLNMETSVTYVSTIEKCERILHVWGKTCQMQSCYHNFLFQPIFASISNEKALNSIHHAQKAKSELLFLIKYQIRKYFKVTMRTLYFIIILSEIQKFQRLLDICFYPL